MVGPFIYADLIGPDRLAAGRGVDVDAHPHIGLATITYLFEGALVHRDSIGEVQRIDAGAVNWMTAGHGVVHTERTPDDHRAGEATLWGLQSWVALPRDAEGVDPSFQHASADAVPESTIGGATVRVVVGEGFGLTAPVEVASPLVLAEVIAGPDGAELVVPPDHPELAVLAVDADLGVDGEDVPAHHLAVLTPGAEATVSIPAGKRAMLLGGDPVGERLIWWNFVSSDREAIEVARKRWAEQRFPRVPGDHDPWIPLPDEGS